MLDYQIHSDSPYVDDAGPELARAVLMEQRERWKRIQETQAVLAGGSALHPKQRRLQEGLLRYLKMEYAAVFDEAESAFGAAAVEDMRRLTEGRVSLGHLPAAARQMTLF